MTPKIARTTERPAAGAGDRPAVPPGIPCSTQPATLSAFLLKFKQLLYNKVTTMGLLDAFLLVWSGMSVASP